MATLTTRQLGSSTLQVPTLGFGSAPLGDLYQRLPEQQALDAVAKAYALNLRLFDTAPFYGYGLSEHRVGHILRQQPRDSYILSTKIGRCLEPRPAQDIDRGQWAGGLDFQPVFDYSYDGVMKSVEQSMQRLGLSRLDILLVHDIDTWTHGSFEVADQHFRQLMDSGYRALDELRHNNQVQAIGVGNNQVEWCLRFAREGDFDCILCAGRYTLLEQTALDEFLPLCEQKEIGIMLGGPFNSGILATGPGPDSKYNYQPAPDEIQQRVGRIQAVCERHNVPLAAAALQFPLGHTQVSTIIPGAANAFEVERNYALMTTTINATLWQELQHEGLIRQEAPLPT